MKNNDAQFFAALERGTELGALALIKSFFSQQSAFLPKVNLGQALPGKFNVYVNILDDLAFYNHPQAGMRAFIDARLDAMLSQKTVDALIAQSYQLPYPQLDKLFSVLSLLCHCYRWDYVPALQSTYAITFLDFPPKLWRLFSNVADQLQLPYCGTLYSTTLSNFYIPHLAQWQTYDPVTIDFNDIQIAHNWLPDPYSQQLSQWVKIFVMTEMYGAHSNQACVKVLEGVYKNNIDQIEMGLIDLYEGIQKITHLFNTHIRHVHLDTHQWRELVQPIFIWGLQSDERFDHKLEGASGLQLACIPLIDLVLGIPNQSAMGVAVVQSRMYLPVAFNHIFTSMEKIKHALPVFMASNSATPTIKQRYKACIQAMLSYRLSHMQRGKVYIKGDGSNKAMTTTGLSAENTYNTATVFEKDMKDRMKELKNQLHAVNQLNQ